MIPGQPGWPRARRQAAGRDLAQVEQREAISVRRVRTHEQDENLLVPSIDLEDEGESG